MEQTHTKRQFQGTVRTISGAKSVVVEVRKRVMHRVYGKYINRVVKYMAHDEETLCGVGDMVLIEECRPMSTRKRWRIVKKLDKSGATA